MKKFKKDFIVPLMVMLFAAIGAFATNLQKDQVSLAEVDGYIDSPEPCELSIKCSTIEGPLCRDGSIQVFGMDENGTTCSAEVYELQL